MTSKPMDFVGFESFSDDPLPLPQPTLSLPLKSNIENLGLKLSNFNQLRNLLSQNTLEDDASEDTGVRLAEKYALLSLRVLGTGHENDVSTEKTAPKDDTRVSALAKRLARALNPSLPDATVRELCTRLEAKITDIQSMVDPGVVGSMARKNLRGEIESDLIRSHAAVLADYSKTVKGLKFLGERVASLDALVEETNSMLARDHELTSKLTTLVDDLAQKRVSVNLKKGLLASFRQMFTLNEYEEYVLSSGDINAEFFSALAHAEEINEKCLVLLALDNPQLGLKVMAKNNELINRSVDKTLAFCNRSLSNLYLLNNKARVDTLHMCFRYLKRRPGHFGAVVNAFVDSRSAVLLNEFSQQASGNESTTISDSRPVFYSSHDPVRYIADLLAYVHSVVVNETETVSGLFAEEKEEFASTVDDIVLRALGSLARPIKSQIDSLLSVETKLPVLYQMFSHLDLYQMMFAKLKHGEKLTAAIAETIATSQEKLVTVVTNRLATVRNSNQAQIDLSVDLQPPEWIIDFYAELLPIVDAVPTETVFNLSVEEHAKFLELIVDEPIAIFNGHLALVAKSLNKRDVLIFKQNFLDVVLSKIMPLSLLSDKVLELNHVINDYSAELTTIQLGTLLEDCELTDFYNVVNMICPVDEYFDASVYQAITENKMFTKEIVSRTNDTIHTVLPTALLDIQLALMKLNSPMIVNDIITDSSTRFTRFYKLFGAIVEEFMEETLLTWSDHEVATLLGIELAYDAIQ